jgi:hypothetical protein
MERATYQVVQRDGAWSVHLNGKYFGPCPTRISAVNAAVRAAAVAIENGCRARVLVQDAGYMRTAWDSETGLGEAPPAA